ncbi:hypothetical protein K2V61_11900 [Staphylococcus simulans]|uniref:sigma factor-like helix-turn-helix DNA-binding protein n=1 Tax=Staphylococcus simulans TaxID=1286 RepID=UPI001E510CB7|nr:sigma factor-like helix-turn-helix DNA-binding protein [Staphylococcus simulans]MCD8916244.1 hypothetical protein [Staphylococcus simulans]
MLKEVIDIPQFIDINKVKEHSYFFNKYLNDALLENLRHLYIHDIKSFNLLTKEIYIRGLSFKDKYKNNYLKKNNYNHGLIIYKKSNENSYKTFPFREFGLGDLVKDLKVDNDLFFNYVPIEAIYKYIPSEKQQMFQYKLKEFGFTLLVEDEITKILSENKYRSDKSEENCNEKNLMNSAETSLIPGGELQEILERGGHNYKKFVENYFSDDNLKSKHPYKYGEEILGEIISQNEDLYKRYEKRRDSAFNKLKNNSLYKDIKEFKASNFLSSNNLTTIIFDEEERIAELGNEFHDIYIAQVIATFLNKVAPLNTSIKTLLKHLTAKEKFVIYERYCGQTYEQIGVKMGITRERVRQIINKTNTKLLNSQTMRVIKMFVDTEISENNILSTKEFFTPLMDIKSNLFLINYMILLDGHYIMSSDEKMVFHQEKFISIEKEIEEKLIDNPVYIEARELMNWNLNDELIYDDVFRRKYYKKVNDRYVNKNLTISAAVSGLFKMFKGKEFENSERGFNEIKNMLYHYLDFTINSNQRSLFARVNDAENIIMVDKGIYKYEEFRSIDVYFVNEIKNKINLEIESKGYADPRTIFQKNTKLINDHNIHTYTHLYFMIKTFFKDDFNVGHQNTLHIYSKENDQVSSEQILLKYIKRNGLTNKGQLMKDLEWNETKLEQSLARVEDIIITDQGNVVSIKGIEQSECYSELISYIKECLSDGYAYTVDILMDILFDKRFNETLKNYYIDNTMGLSQFVKSKISGVRGHKLFLYYKDMNVNGVEDVVLEDLPKVLSSQELKNFLLKKGYSQQKYYISRKVLLEREKILPYTSDVFLNTSKIQIDEINKEKYIREVERLLCDSYILTYSNLESIEVPLNAVEELNITPICGANLINSNNNIRVIEPYQNARYELPILVSKNGPKSYDELVWDLINEKYKGANDSTELVNFLKHQELMNRGTNGVYSILKKSDLFFFNDIGLFHLKSRRENNV